VQQKIFVSLFLAFFLGIVLLTSSFQEVKATGTIYIRADGSVEGTDKLQRNGNIYTFTGDINGEIIVEIDDIVINGADYLLQGYGTGVGISINYQNNVTIKNLQINNFSSGIGFEVAYNNTISSNLLLNNGVGIHLTDSDNNIFTGNTFMDNEQGFYLFICYNNSIYNNSYINNTRQVFDNWFINPALPEELESVNIWYNGTTGNYWSDYNGTDNNADGIGDSPYIINNLNQDNYPLIEEFIIPEFPSLTPLLIAGFFTTILASIAYRRKIKQGRKNE